MTGAAAQVAKTTGPRSRDNEIILGVGAGLLAIVFAVSALQGINATPKALPAIIVLAVAGPWLLRRPEWLVPLFAAVTWTAVGRGTFGGLPTPVEVGGPLLLGAAAWFALPQLRFARDVAVVCLLIGVPVIIAGLLSPVDATIQIGVFKDLTFLLIVALGLRSVDDVERVGLALCMTGIALALGAVYSIQVGPIGPFSVSDEGSAELGTTALRAAGPFGDPNFFALAMAAILPFALHRTTHGGWSRAVGATAVVALSFGLLATGSRGGLLAAVLGIVVFGVSTPTRTARPATLAALIVGMALVPLFGDTLDTSATRSVEGRTTENLVAVAMFADHPLTGVGPDLYPALYRDYTREIGNDPRVMRLPHSLPLQIAAEQGLAGLLAWAALLLMLLRLMATKRLWHWSIGRAAAISLGLYLFGSLFLHAGQPRIIYMLIGIILALGVSPPREQQVVRAA